MASHVSSYYFPNFCSTAVATEPKAATIPATALSLNDFELYCADYQPNVGQAAQPSFNQQFINNIPVNNAMTFASPISSLLSPPGETFDSRIQHTNNHFCHHHYHHFDYYRFQNIQNQEFIDEQRIQNQLFQQYPNVKNFQFQDSQLHDPAFCTNTNYEVREENLHNINFLEERLELNCSDNMRTFFNNNNNKDIRATPLNSNNNNQQSLSLSTVTELEQMSFTSATSVTPSLSRMSSSPGGSQQSSLLSISSNCSLTEFPFSLSFPSVDTLNCSTSNMVSYNNSLAFCVNNSFPSISNNTKKNKKHKKTSLNDNKTATKWRKKSKKKMSATVEETTPIRQKRRTTTLNLTKSAFNIVLSPEICAKVFYPPSAVNPQKYTRNLRRSRIELSQKRIHQCREPGKYFFFQV